MHAIDLYKKRRPMHGDGIPSAFEELCLVPLDVYFDDIDAPFTGPIAIQSINLDAVLANCANFSSYNAWLMIVALPTLLAKKSSVSTMSAKPLSLPVGDL